MLREIRIEKGMTQNQFAELTGVNQGSVSRYERNIRLIPVTAAKRLAKNLGINWWELYEDNEKENENDDR